MDNHAPPSRNFPLWLLAPLLPLLYVASVGPVIKVLGPNSPSMAYLLKFYAPLQWAYEHSRWCARALEFYLQLWGIK